MIQDSYQHVLTIGTTGMLAAATRVLAQRATRVTCLARTPASLGSLAASMPTDAANLHPVAVDYQHSDAFMKAVQDANADTPIDLVVAWFHRNGLDTCKRLIGYLNSQASPVGVFHVVGSAARDPSNPAQWPQPEAGGVVTYHQIILGFVLEAESSRWLTHQEISDGVLEAIQHKYSRHIIGTVRPWSARP
ncbi:MAG: short-chain dehydrogenase [Deinococcota bacterium]